MENVTVGEGTWPVVRHDQEVVVQMRDSSTSVVSVLRLVATEGIRVHALCAYSHDDGTKLLLVTDDAVATQAVMRLAGYECQINPVIRVTAPHQTGLAALLGAQLQAAGITILYAYASWRKRQRASFIFKTKQNE